jgi:2-oxoglutarate dehydrogenase E2 component (dihydrolipoamide succinyltransferase)
MPQLGESVTEGTISKWLKAKGDAVNEYDPLVEVNTDKVDTEIPSPVTGVLLDILMPEGAVAKVGALLALIGQPGEEPVAGGQLQVTPSVFAASMDVTISTPQTTRSPQPVAGAPRDLGFISPVVAKLAAEHGIDLSQVPGAGLGGRITKKDVLAFVERGKPGTGIKATGKLVEGEDDRGVQGKPAAISTVAHRTGKLGTLIPHTTIRRRIAEHMVHSKHTSPHVTTVMEVDLSRVVAHREANKAAFARDGANLTFTAYFIAAIVAALKAYPIVNSSWGEEGIHIHPEINIGMATSLGEEGLIVPVIKQADGLSLLGLARAVNDLAQRARAHKLQPDEVKGGTFTLTNHGISGSLFATPIINQPQCGILGVGAIQKRPVVISDDKLGDVIAIRPMVYVSLTFDHRILDGATADWFLAKVVESLKNWV